jgi:hypothetical protein
MHDSEKLTIEEEEALVLEGLKKGRADLLRALKDRRRMADNFGRRWGVAGGIAILAGLLVGGPFFLVVESGKKADEMLASFWVALVVLCAGIVVIRLSMHAGIKARAWGLIIVPPACGILSSLPLGSEAILGNFILGLVYFPAAAFIFGPFVSLVARLKFPNSRFAARLGLSTGIVWMICFFGGVLIAAFMLWLISQWPYANPIIGLYLFTAAFVASALPGAASAVIAIFNGSSNPPAKAKRMARLSIILGMVCAAMYLILSHVLLIIFYIYASSEHEPHALSRCVLSIASIWCAAGFFITSAMGYILFFLNMTHKDWSRQVKNELRRLHIEIKGSD